MGNGIRPARGMTTRSNDALAKEIVKLWKDECKDGLDGKRLHADVLRKFEPRFFDHVLDKLKKGDVFTAADKKATKRVAKDVGKVCKMMSKDSDKSVSLDTFEGVFKLLRGHAACPTGSSSRVIGAGAGTWCDVPIV